MNTARIPLLALATLTLLGLAGCARAHGDAGTVFLGVAGPLQQSSGRSLQQAAKMAVDEVNAAGGAGGHRLGLVPKDDGADPQRAIEVAGELRDDPRIVAVVGHINSSATLAAARIYNDPANPVVEISPASSSPAISAAGVWTFRVCPTDLQHGPALADWAYGPLGSRHAEVLYANDAYGRGVLQSFVAAFQRDGGTVIGQDPYLAGMLGNGDTIDPYLQRAMKRDADALMIAGQAEPARKIIDRARALGYTGPVLGPDGLTSLRDAGPDAQGVYISSAFLPDRDTPSARKFVSAYSERFGEPPDHRAAMAYDAVLLLARAIAAVGPERQAIRDYLASVGSSQPAYEGVSGTIAFDANGDVAGKEVTIGVVRDGNLVTAHGAAGQPVASTR